MTVRAFLALPVEEPILDRLAGTAREMAADSGTAGVRWVDPRGYHVTLKFLGSVESEALEGIVGGLSDLLSEPGNEPIALHFRGIGAFGRTRVVIARVEEPTGRLDRLVGELERLVVRHGIRPESRRYRPHVTLARVKAPDRDPGTLAGLNEAISSRESLFLGTSLAREVVLYRSDSTPTGVKYTPLDRFVLVQDPAPPIPEPPKAS